MQTIRWGIIGCGNVTEVKSGPGFQRAAGSALAAVMRRDRAKAEDYARRHGVTRVHGTAAELIDDPEIDAVYIATTPDSHCDLALQVARAHKPCLVEKPMAMTHAECLVMVDTFRDAGVPLWVAYYRRALPRFLAVRDLLNGGAIGQITSVHVLVGDRLATAEGATAWRFDPAIGGGGRFFDLASHCFDLLDFFIGRLTEVSGFALNTGHRYAAEDVTVAAFQFGPDVLGTGTWNFNASSWTNSLTILGSEGELAVPIFDDGDVVVTRGGVSDVRPFRNPPHVHQPLIQQIVDELQGRGRCESTGETGARASWALDRCVDRFYREAARTGVTAD